ncbi:UNVERIFIED_CONTAM: hypothetical protein Sindi_2487600, partial [Sesamum indicum]
PSKQVLTEIKQYLDRLFTIKDLGTARFFLDLEIARSNEGITDLCRLNPLQPLCQAGCKVTVSKEEQMLDPESYRRLLGRLMYLGFTSPDIFYGTQQLCQFKQHPCKEHWNATLYLVRYLKGTMNRGLSFRSRFQYSLHFVMQIGLHAKDNR